MTSRAHRAAQLPRSGVHPLRPAGGRATICSGSPSGAIPRNRRPGRYRCTWVMPPRWRRRDTAVEGRRPATPLNDNVSRSQQMAAARVFADLDCYFRGSEGPHNDPRPAARKRADEISGAESADTTSQPGRRSAELDHRDHVPSWNTLATSPTRSAAPRAGSRREIDCTAGWWIVGRSWRWHRHTVSIRGPTDERRTQTRGASARVRVLADAVRGPHRSQRGVRSGPRPVCRTLAASAAARRSAAMVVVMDGGFTCAVSCGSGSTPSARSPCRSRPG